MTIAILGWGSLIWRPESVRIKHPQQWKPDGPCLPVEFARISSGDRLTLVISPGDKDIQVLWNESVYPDWESARKNLCEREGISLEKIGNVVTATGEGYSQFPHVPEVIRQWARAQGIDAVIWTDLEGNFETRRGGERATPANVIKYLKELRDVDKHAEAESYIRRAPTQIETRLRAAIESELHWTYNSNA
jgi:hypothetical protein